MKISVKFDFDLDKVMNIITSWFWLQILNAIVVMIVSFCTKNGTLALFALVLWFSAVALAIVGLVLSLIGIRYSLRHSCQE
ncbi:MAG: hypothetical protein ACI4VO_01870 [Clostridia bacterium]